MIAQHKEMTIWHHLSRAYVAFVAVVVVVAQDATPDPNDGAGAVEDCPAVCCFRFADPGSPLFSLPDDLRGDVRLNIENNIVSADGTAVSGE